MVAEWLQERRITHSVHHFCSHTDISMTLRLIAMKLCGDLHRSNPSMFSSIGIYSPIFLAHFKKYILIYDLEN